MRAPLSKNCSNPELLLSMEAGSFAPLFLLLSRSAVIPSSDVLLVSAGTSKVETPCDDIVLSAIHTDSLVLQPDVLRQQLSLLLSRLLKAYSLLLQLDAVIQAVLWSLQLLLVDDADHNALMYFP